MKNKLIALLLMLSVCMGIQADDQCECEPVRPTALTQGFYVGALGGVNFQESITEQIFIIELYRNVDAKFEWNPGYLAGGFLGYKFSNGLRLEGEVSYRNNTIHKLTLDGMNLDFSLKNDNISYLVNGYFDLYTFSKFTPYVGLGLGYGFNEACLKSPIEGLNLDAKSDGMVLQGIAGVSYLIQSNTELGLEYRFFQARKNFNDHSVALNLKYFFY